MTDRYEIFRTYYHENRLYKDEYIKNDNITEEHYYYNGKVITKRMFEAIKNSRDGRMVEVVHEIEEREVTFTQIT